MSGRYRPYFLSHCREDAGKVMVEHRQSHWTNRKSWRPDRWWWGLDWWVSLQWRPWTAPTTLSPWSFLVTITALGTTHITVVVLLLTELYRHIFLFVILWPVIRKIKLLGWPRTSAMVITTNWFCISQQITVTADVAVLDQEHYHHNPLNLPMTLSFLINHA